MYFILGLIIGLLLNVVSEKGKLNAALRRADITEGKIDKIKREAFEIGAEISDYRVQATERELEKYKDMNKVLGALKFTLKHYKDYENTIYAVITYDKMMMRDFEKDPCKYMELVKGE